MKNLETQVCTLEQAKRLEELLGEDVESSLYWCNSGGTFHISAPCNKGFVTVDETGEVYTESGGEVYNAFTVAELGLMLPASAKILKTSPGFQFGVMKAYKKTWQTYKTEAEARAALLIHLLESGSIKAEEVNQRLT